MNNTINALTSVFGLVGYPVEHSLSPKFWNAAFQMLNLNAVYLAFPVLPDNIIDSLNGLKCSGIKGLNITRPHKQAAADFCNILHEAAEETQVVNTIKFSESGAEGWNTDASGLLNILRKKQISTKSALVIGNGASSKSVIWALKKNGVFVINQIARKFVQEVEEERLENIFFRKFSWNSKNFNNTIEESDIIINTTPIGWHKDDDISEFTNFRKESSKVFVDFNYSMESKLLNNARQFCKTVVDGRELLYEQGLDAFKVLTDFEPPADVIRNSIFG